MPHTPEHSDYFTDEEMENLDYKKISESLNALSDYSNIIHHDYTMESDYLGDQSRETIGYSLLGDPDKSKPAELTYSDYSEADLNMTDAEINAELELMAKHAVLDVGGLVPIYGAGADLVNMGAYLSEGNWGDALLSGISAIPGVGYLSASAKGTKVANRTWKLKRLLELNKKSRKAKEVLQLGTETVEAGQASINIVKSGRRSQEVLKLKDELKGIYKSLDKIDEVSDVSKFPKIRKQLDKVKDFASNKWKTNKWTVRAPIKAAGYGTAGYLGTKYIYDPFGIHPKPVSVLSSEYGIQDEDGNVMRPSIMMADSTNIPEVVVKINPADSTKSRIITKNVNTQEEEFKGFNILDYK